MKTKLLFYLMVIFLSYQLCLANPIPAPFIMEFSSEPPWIEVFYYINSEDLVGDTIRTLESEAIILSAEPFENDLILFDSSNTTGFILNPEGDSIIFSTEYDWGTAIGYGTEGNVAGSPPPGASMVGGVYAIWHDDWAEYEIAHDFCLEPSPGEWNWGSYAGGYWGSSDIVINEICVSSTWRTNSNFIELFNMGTEEYLLYSYKVIGNSIFNIPDGTTIGPGEYYVIDQDQFPDSFDLDNSKDVLYLVQLIYSSVYPVIDQVGWSSNHGDNVSLMRYPDGDVDQSVRWDFLGYNDVTSTTFENGFPTRGAANRHDCPGFVVIGAAADSIDDGSARIHWTDPIWDETFTASMVVKSHDDFVSTPEEGEIIYTGTNQEFIEEYIIPETPYYFTVFARDYGGLYSTPTEESQAFIYFSAVGIKEAILPGQINVLKCYPNPFNAQTTISFSLEKQSPVNISIYDITGRLVDVLISQTYKAGNHSLIWDAGNQPSGIYFARLSAGDAVSTNRMVLLK